MTFPVADLLTKYKTAIALMLAASYLGTANFALAQPEFKQELATSAKTIANFLKQRGDDRIAVGQFTGPSILPSSSGPAIVKVLSEELKALGVEVSRRAKLEVKGDYLPLVDENKRGPAALLKGRILDQTGTVLLEFQQQFSQDNTVAALFGVTVELPPDASPREHRKRLEQSISAPKSFIQKQSRVSAGPNSPFGLEILVKQGDSFQPRVVEDDDGLAFVPITKDQAYAIRIYNDADFDVATTLTIDGLNLFTFSDSPQYKALGTVIVRSKSTGTVYGWHRTNQVSDSFLVTDYAKSAAAELKHTTDLGTITCTFAAAWPEGSSPPPDEGPKRSEVATARGPEVAAEFKEVVRHLGKTRAAISVRYNRPQ